MCDFTRLRILYICLKTELYKAMPLICFSLEINITVKAEQTNVHMLFLLFLVLHFEDTRKENT